MCQMLFRPRGAVLDTVQQKPCPHETDLGGGVGGPGLGGGRGRRHHQEEEGTEAIWAPRETLVLGDGHVPGEMGHSKGRISDF